MTYGASPLIRAEVARFVIPLTRPVYLGTVKITERAYVALKFELANGALGFAYGYDRGMPLFEIAVEAARRYIGHNAQDCERLRHSSLGATPAPRATMVRGVSLCDIALWDAAAQSAGKPLHALLGTRRERIELMPVIGYGMTPQSAAQQGADLAARGFRSVKVMINGADLAADIAVVTALASALPPTTRFGMDAHWSWQTADQALPWCRLAEETGAIFLEDPVAPTAWRVAADLKTRTSVPLCLGEDAINLDSLRDMAEGADILRIDAAASGGIGFALEGLTLAKQHGKTVIPHVFATLHQHLGFSDACVSRIEAILPEIGADPIDDYLLQPLEIDAGDLVAPQAAGAGLALNWAALARFRTHQEILLK